MTRRVEETLGSITMDELREAPLGRGPGYNTRRALFAALGFVPVSRGRRRAFGARHVTRYIRAKTWFGPPLRHNAARPGPGPSENQPIAIGPEARSVGRPTRDSPSYFGLFLPAQERSCSEPSPLDA